MGGARSTQGEIRNAYRMLAEKPDRRRPLRTPENNIV
jgi:hypothetical protein